MPHQNPGLKSFTLAEVLITLAIIGIVAAISIPALNNKVQDMQNITAWKKTYAEVTLASKKIANDEGGSLIGTFGDNDTIEKTMRDSFTTYLKANKKCDDGNEVTDGCWHKSDKWYRLSGEIANHNLGAEAGFIMSNGTLFSFSFTSPDCESGVTQNTTACGSIYIDVNGFKGPNTIGKDIYSAWILKSGEVRPWGTQGDYYYNRESTYSCNKDSYPSTYGWNCSSENLYK